MVQITTASNARRTHEALILIAGLCVLGIVMAPIASASAIPFVGSCEINGNAKFERPLSNTTPKATNTNSKAASARPARRQVAP
jgi:hypothetical protein